MFFVRCKKSMTILFFGDVFGKPGREVLQKILPLWQKKYKPDFVIGNIENIAHGSGVTKKTLDEIDELGIFNIYTSGDHILDKEEAKILLQNYKTPILGPANTKPTLPGKSYAVITNGTKSLLVINLIGKVFIKNSEKFLNPLLTADEILKNYTLDKNDSSKQLVNAILVDFHAEATAEKRVLGAYLDGRVSAVIGTHTHVPTRDEQILPRGTAYISDVGMVGSFNSSLGLDFKGLIQEYLTDVPQKRKIGDDPRVEIGAVLIELNRNGLSKKIQHLREIVQK